MDSEVWSGGINAAHLDTTLPVPLYHQIYLLLRDKIRAGNLTSGEVLPGEQELAKIFNVSRITVKRSLNELASDGFVTRHRGRGTVVSSGRIVPIIRGSFTTLMRSLKMMGLETKVELLEVSEIEADQTIADRLELAPGTPVQRAVRRRKIESEPFSHIVSYVPGRIAARYSVDELRTTPLLVLLERAGAASTSAEQWITAVAADPVIAATLAVAPSAALLRIERVMRSADGIPVQLIYAHYRPDRFQYHLWTHRRGVADDGADGWRDDH